MLRCVMSLCGLYFFLLNDMVSLVSYPLYVFDDHDKQLVQTHLVSETHGVFKNVD